MSHHTIRHREESSAREIIRVWWRRWCRRLFVGLGLMLAGVPVSFLGMYLIDEFNRQNPKPELFALGGLAFAFAGGIVSVAGLIAGIAFGIAFAKMGAPSLLVAAVAWMICIQNKNFRYLSSQIAVATAIMFVIGLYGMRILDFWKSLYH